MLSGAATLLSPECRIFLTVKESLGGARRWLLILCHFVGPLIFFTNLTRNPYVTQIALVNAGVALALTAWAWSEASRADGWRLPRLSEW